MKIVVFGGAGFIGSHLTKKLTLNNYEIIVVDNLSTGKIENVPDCVKFYNLDVRFSNFDEILKDVDIVFYLAAMARVQPSIENPLLFNDVNVNGLLNVLVSCIKNGVKKFVFSSSSSVYGNTDVLPTKENVSKSPMSPYGLQKLIGEQYCELFSKIYNLDTVILRYFNVYGDGMPLTGAYRTVLSIFGSQYLNNESFTITNDGNQRRDFTFVEDVVQANILVGFSEKIWNGECFNVGSGKSYSINEVVEFFNYKDLTYIGEKIEPRETLSDSKKIKETLGWEVKGDLKSWIKKYMKNLVHEDSSNNLN